MKIKHVISIFFLFLIIIVVILLIRTALISKTTTDSSHTKRLDLISIDSDKAAQNLSQAIQFKTVTQQNVANTDWSVFLEFQSWLRITYPDFYNAVTSDTVASYTPILQWEGTNSELSPIVFLAHQDVVPALEDDENWEYSPFEGKVADGYIFGRGAIDDKGSLIGLHEAANRLAASGYQPERTLIFIFGHDEEVGGEGAKAAVKWLQSRDISPYAVIDEGGFIVTGFNGIEKPIALISIAEKDYFTVTLTAKAEGGHSSAPSEYTAIGALSRAIAAVEANPFESGLNAVTTRTIKAMAPEQDFMSRMAIANLWLFKSVVEKKMRSENASRTLLGTSVAPTIVQGGFKENAMPREAVAHINFRIHPRDSRISVLEHLRRIINDPAIEIKPLENPSASTPAVSNMETGVYVMISNIVEEVYPDMIVAPNLLAGGTDSRYFSVVTPNIYRFSPLTLKAEEVEAIHGLNERVSIESYTNAIGLYYEMLHRSGANQSD